MKTRLKQVIPLAIDYSLAVLAASKVYAKNNKFTPGMLLPFLVEIGFHTLFHLGSKGILVVILTKKGRGAGVKALQWAFIISKPVLQHKVLHPVLAHPKFLKASQKVETFIKKFL